MTPAQRDLRDFIQSYQRLYVRTPTYERMAAHLHISRGNAHDMVSRMEKTGDLIRHPDGSIEIVVHGWFTHVGKQVLANGMHYADMADETAAAFAVAALNAHAELHSRNALSRAA